MTRLEYQLLRDNRKDLNFPPYWMLTDYQRKLLEKLPEERVIARRTAIILSRGFVPEPDSSLPELGYEY